MGTPSWSFGYLPVQPCLADLRASQMHVSGWFSLCSSARLLRREMSLAVSCTIPCSARPWRRRACACGCGRVYPYVGEHLAEVMRRAVDGRDEPDGFGVDPSRTASWLRRLLRRCVPNVRLRGQGSIRSDPMKPDDGRKALLLLGREVVDLARQRPVDVAGVDHKHLLP